MKHLFYTFVLSFMVAPAWGQVAFEEVSGTPFEGVNNSSIAFADIDGDGDQDVLITGYTGSKPIATLYENDGSGVFTKVEETPFEEVDLGSIAFADVDGDGDQDLLITGSNSSSNTISRLYENDGSGVFTEVEDTPFEGVRNSSIAFADIDGDGDQDVLITGWSGSERISRLYENDGSGVFTEVEDTPFEDVRNSSIAFADVDGDGDQDVLITGDQGSTHIAILYLNDGSGAFTEVEDTPFWGVIGSIAFADIDGDGDQDLVKKGNTGSGKVSQLYENDGFGAFTRVTDRPFSYLDGVDQGSIAFADVDGDGDQDLLITGSNKSSNTISKLYENDGSGVFTEVEDTPFEGVRNSSIAFADVDGDGDQDVLITGRNSSNDRIAKLYKNNSEDVASALNNLLSEEINIYTAEKMLYIHDEQNRNKEVHIMDLSGRVIDQFHTSGNENQGHYLKMQQGVYVVNIKTGSGIMSKRIRIY